MLRSGIRIGRIAGINITVDWSWLFIFLLVTWDLAAGLFPSLHPDWNPPMNIGMGLVAALLFFASVLAHELAHSIVARARGLPVKRITLFFFGGVSNIEREPPSALTEFLMAIVGPLTSLVLGLAFTLWGTLRAGISFPPRTSLVQMLSGLDPLTTLLLWLGPVNLILAVFNMVPGFPLDGGRVLRSILWAASGNLHRATRWAAVIGQTVAWAFILAGIAMAFGIQIPFFGTGLISGLWLAFIGWFLLSAAAQSYQQVVVEDMLEGVRVSRLMHSSTPTVTPVMMVGDLVYHYMLGTDERAFPVLENDRLVGLVCLEDVRKVPREDWDKIPVSQIMTPSQELKVVTPQEDAAQALQVLNERDVRQVPVVQDGHLVGMLRRRDILRWLQLQGHTTG
jgi:Zn-dependent protease/CBS domain-containing protein